MITPHILIISAGLSIAWLLVLHDAIAEYRRMHQKPVAERRVADRRHGEPVRAFRTVVLCICLLSISTAYVLRTGLVLAGFGEAFTGQVIFFALLGTNVVGALYCAISLRYD